MVNVYRDGSEVNLVALNIAIIWFFSVIFSFKKTFLYNFFKKVAKKYKFCLKFETL